MTVSVHQAQLHLADLLARSSRGEEVIIFVEDGSVAARLVPASPPADDFRLGFLKDKLEIVVDDDAHLADFAEYMR